MSNILLRASDVTLILEGKTLVEGVSFDIASGQMVTLVGPNGSGKTTLLKLALGLMAPSQGHIWRAPHLRVGYMPQKVFLSHTLPLNVLSFLTLTASRARALACLLEVGAGRLQDASMHVLSGGEMQRVLLARALLRDPNLLVLDEPLQGVDPKGQESLYALLQELKEKKGVAILLVSHDLYFVHKASDLVLCLNGHVCCAGKPEDVRQDPRYHALFGEALPTVLAPYTHHHDHHHDGAPDVCGLKAPCRGDH